MDKSAGNKKRSPAGTTRRAYSIFGGIINLAQQQQQNSHSPKSNVLSSTGNTATVGSSSGGGSGGGGGTSQDPQGSTTNVYTVTVTNSESPDNTNQVTTYENLVPVKKQKGDQSTSAASSLTPSSSGMSSNSGGNSGGGGGGGGGGGRIGPAPRTLSILTALNELAISDEIEANPTSSPLTPSASAGNNRTSGASTNNSSSNINNVSSAKSKSNPTHSSSHYPLPNRASYGGNTYQHHHLQQQQQQQHHHHFLGNKVERTHENLTSTANVMIASSTSSSSALLHHHNNHHHQQYISPKHVTGSGTTVVSSSSSVYHSTSSSSAVRGLYSTNSNPSGGNNARMTKGYNEQLGAPPPPLPPYGNFSSNASKFPYSITSPYAAASSGNNGGGGGGGASSSAAAASTANTLPLALRRTGNKSRGSHKESSTRKGSSGGAAAAAAAKQRDRSKSRTPDWIWKIFQLTKHGKLEELQHSLLGLDPTLIRHLADAKGNTVLHCAARGGHVNTLQWLVSVLGSQCTEAALNDHNQAGRTVILTALKKRQLECLQWLVHQTKCGEKALVPNEGERSLLHHAATIGDLNVVRWLCSELIDKGICVDIRDAGGMTPLHDAAKSGHITVCHELILAGADPLSQTELGWRPSDLAIRHRHMECASYFMVAEAAGSLGNQLHSLVMAFNHLRQEHEELRLHFRETLRVGKWLAKERNDLIKQFPTKWTQEAGSSGGGAGANAGAAVASSSPSLLLGGTNNGTRFSDLEHKLVVAEQAWKKLSQNSDKAGVSSSNDEILNGEESSLSNVSSHDFLHRRLAAVQLRHERSQSLGNSQLSSGSSDEDPYEEENSSSSDASSSDVDVERITSITAGSGGGGGGGSSSSGGGMMATMMMMMMGQNSPAITHSSTVSSLPKKNGGGSGGGGGSGTMRTRPSPTATNTTSKAAPWLLPPNDAFLSQLSPFVGAHGGKSLPTMDLLNGAPTSPSLLSSIVSPSSPSAVASTLHHPPASGTSPASAVAPATTTDTAGKNEKSLVQMDTERHGSNHAGKRDSTSLEISVLEVIEPTTHASPASSSFKKSFHQAPDLICGTQYRARHVDKQGMSPQKKKQQPTQSLSLRGHRQRKDCYYSHSEENLVGYYHLEGADGVYEPISPYHQDDDRHSCQQQRYSEKKSFPFSTQHYQPDNFNRRRLSNPSFAKSADFLDSPTTIYKGESSSGKEGKVSFSSTSQLYSKDENEQLVLSRPSSSLSVSLSAARKNKTGEDNEQRLQSGMIACAHASASSSSHEKSCDNEICYNEAGKVNKFPNSCGALASGAGTGSGSSGLHSVEVMATHSGAGYGFDNASSSGNSSSTRNIISKSRTPSPKSYVTKLTVIPVEATTETCFLSVRSTSFARKGEEDGEDGGKGDQQQQQQQLCAADAVVEIHPDHHYHHHRHEEQEDEEESHQLDLPGDNPDELCSLAFSCQIPSYSVSSSNTPVMPRFNSSGTVVFPLRKPSSEWHSTELLSLTTPDSSLAGRLSPTPSETSRTESALAPPPSYVSHASQNSEVSKTESARGHHHHHQFPMNEVSAEERDLESPVGDDSSLHLQTSFINHPSASASAAASSSTFPFQSIHPHHLAIAVSSAQAVSQRLVNSSQNSNNNNTSNNNNSSGADRPSQKMELVVAGHKNSAMVMTQSFEEMCESDRKKGRDYSSVSNNNNNNSTTKKDHNGDDDHDDDKDDDRNAASSAKASSSAAITAIVDDNDDGDHGGDNDRSSVKQRGLFEKQQNRRIRACTPTTSTTRFIRSHLSTTTINNNNTSSSSTSTHKASSSAQQQHHRLPKSKGHHHHNSHQRGLSSKPWYEIEGSDDEGSLLLVAKSRANNSSNFSNSINSTNNNNSSSSNMSSGNSSTTSSSNNAATSSSATTSNLEEESSSQNDSAAEENENNNSIGGGGDDGGTEAEQNEREDVGVQVQKVGQSSTILGAQSQQQQQQQQQQNSSTTVTSNKTRNCSNFL